MNLIREKILLLLLGGLALGCSYTPGRQRMVFRTISKEWAKLNHKELRKGIDYLYRLKLVDKCITGGGITIAITKKGKLFALNKQLENIRNKSGKWDKKWRMVAFDIPEKYRQGRNALRSKLMKIGFCELQKSVLITPYECEKEIKQLVDYFELVKYVRFGVLETIDNGDYFKKFFKL